ncbi:hypothetical protein ELG88_08415 [Rhizobium leguminosarum]|uniref:hypothetical protein n=1 Tax=Rhizobium leguminosarum TaxID=384 RepID=UPI001031946C|nr:hypothetical protein [Rhizobium leguminosarum]TBF35237.1 hypothetical protein ELG88_08415 [Rhizobium leguminosarum]
MRFMKNRIAEIQERLGPVLDALGVEPKMLRKHDRAVAISFLPKGRRTRFSPVEIEFPDRRKLGEAEASWEHAHLNVHEHLRIPLKGTDWECWEYHGQSRHEIKGEGDEMFDWLSFVLDYNGALPTGAVTPKTIANADFARAFNIFAGGFKDVAIIQDPKGELGHPIETLSFVDDLGRYVELPMREGDAYARLYIDGNEVAGFYQSDTRMIERISTDIRLSKDARISQPDQQSGRLLRR